RIASHGGRARQATCHEACGYVDDPLRGPAALPPCSPEEGEHGEMLAFAHIPTGATATTGLNRLTKMSTMSPVQSVNHLSGCTGGRAAAGCSAIRLRLVLSPPPYLPHCVGEGRQMPCFLVQQIAWRS